MWISGCLFACGGKVVAQGDVDTPGSGPVWNACDDYFQTIYGGNDSCGAGPLPPSSEATHLQNRFDTWCSNQVALPGSAYTVSSIEACVAAIRSESCVSLEQQQQTSPNAPCSFASGALATGSPCRADNQCQSGICSGGDPSFSCGATCAVPIPPIALGGSCSPNDSAACGPSAVCAGDTSDNSTCAGLAYVDAGGACQSLETACIEGLTCTSFGTCAAPAEAGAPCGASSDCAPPLVCPDFYGEPAPTCQAPGSVGASCGTISGNPNTCGPGLTCASAQCTPVTWVLPGQPCSNTAWCLVGGSTGCPPPTKGSSTGVCPTLLDDGQPCSRTDVTSSCDDFASCLGGTCVFGYPSCP